MVTFYRKAQINGTSLSDRQPVGLPPTTQQGQWDAPQYRGMVNPEDELPYVVVRPKVNRKNNNKILRMRSHWD